MTASLLTGVHRLECLLRDLRWLHESDFRVIDVAADAPMLRDQKKSARRAPCLEGTVHGHPTVPDGKPIITSELYVFLEQDGELYSRILNRGYRLQASAGPRYRA